MKLKIILLQCMALLAVHCCNAQTGTIITIAGTGFSGYYGDNKPAIGAKLNRPDAVAMDRHGNVFVADADNHRIRKIDRHTGIIITVAGKDSMGYSGDNGQATNAKLFAPDGVAVDTNSNVFIADRNNSRVRRVDAITGIITTIAGTGVPGYGGDSGPATAALLRGPVYLHFDKHGDLYVGDYDNNTVRKINMVTGTISTVAGCGVYASSPDGTIATNAGLKGVFGVCTDDTGNVYIAETDGEKIKKVGVSTGLLVTIAGTGVTGSLGNNGPAIAARLSTPGGLFIDKNGNVVFAEKQNGAIRHINQTTGIITTIAGVLGGGGSSADNIPATAAAMAPYDVQPDSAGNLVIADDGTHRVRVVCYDTMCLKIPDTTTAVTEVCNPSLMRLYTLAPNPTTDLLRLTQSEQNNDAVEVAVYDVVSNKVFAQQVRFSNGVCSLDVSHLPSGMYMLRVSPLSGGPGGQGWCGRFVVE